MSVSPFDSALFRDLFGDPEVGRLFSDSAEIRAMMIVEGTLARVQGAAGVIPEDSAAFLHRASLELQIDPGGLAAGTGQNGVCVPALVAAFRKATEAPDHAQYLHWGATSQDVIDTALALRLKQALALIEGRLGALLAGLARLAEAQAETPMAGRTYGQIATPTSFGAVLAGWGEPHLAHLDRLDALRPRLLRVALFGAAGTSAALGPQARQIRQALAEGLGLRMAEAPWHSGRDGIADLAGWLTLVTGSLAKMGEDMTLLTMSEVGELHLAGAGGSSTMPQKQNPVGPSVLVALARHVAALNTAMQGALAHRQQRDGAAWFTEWLSLPAMVVATARAVQLAADLTEAIQPRAERMAANLNDPLGLIHAEALSFALAAHLPRPEAQAAIKALCLEARDTATPLPDLAARDHPALDTAAALAPGRLLGEAPEIARGFAGAVADRGA